MCGEDKDIESSGEMKVREGLEILASIIARVHIEKHTGNQRDDGSSEQQAGQVVFRCKA